MRTVHVVGNSHVMYFAGRVVESDKEHVGQHGNLTVRCFKAGDTGATVYGLGNENSKTGAGKKIREYVSANSVHDLVVVLGDVDFREHLIKHMDGTDPLPLMKKVVGMLAEYIRSQLLPLMFPCGKVVLFEMVPFTEVFFRKMVKRDLRNAALWFFWVQFNQVVQEAAKENGWQTISIRDDVVSPDGFLRAEFGSSNDEDVHVNPEKVQPFVLEKLKVILGQG